MDRSKFIVVRLSYNEVYDEADTLEEAIVKAQEQAECHEEDMAVYQIKAAIATTVANKVTRL